jgi:hypothetical protein
VLLSLSKRLGKLHRPSQAYTLGARVTASAVVHQDQGLVCVTNCAPIRSIAGQETLATSFVASRLFQPNRYRLVPPPQSDDPHRVLIQLLDGSTGQQDCLG